MAKTVFLQIRITPEDRDRLKEAATADYLDLSTWARRVLLAHLDSLEGRGDYAGRLFERREGRSGASAARKKKRR